MTGSQGGGAQGAELDTAALYAFLSDRMAGFDHPDDVTVTQFAGGQSNPTFLLATPAHRYVLRKKPTGRLLASAHAIEREFRLMNAISDHIPVPRMHVLCEDERVIGQAFYVMDYVEGRVLADARLLEAPETERRGMCFELVSVLARLHRIDYLGEGLDDFGRSGGYVERQLVRLAGQYEASRFEPCADMDRTIAWLRDNLPTGDESAIVHGDYRSYNVLFAPDAPRIAAVLDWELATIGHPIADLAFCCLPYHLPAEDLRGFYGSSPAELGIPSEAELIDRYCRETGWDDLSDWRFFLVFSLFRSAAIRAGVYRRAMDGTAASPEAVEKGRRYREAAAAAARLIAEGVPA